MYLNLANSIKTSVDIRIRIADSVIPNSKSDSIVEIIANGIAWVSPVRLPANTKVAPNSEIARAQPNAAPLIIDFQASGKLI